jgi:hypothetical protein
MDKEVSRLWLNSASLTTTLGATGIKTANNKSLTFNLDMRLVLGETLWSKYEYFKMYFTDPTPTATGLNFVTIFQNGLNLIQASYMGNTPGFNTALTKNIGTVYSNSTNTVQLNFYEKQNNLCEYIMIKPNINYIQLTLTLTDELFAGSNQVTRPFFITFVPYEDKIIYKNPYNYLFQNEQVNFTLSTAALVTGGTNQNGTMNANRTQFTFTNVNLRNIIGTLWDKYNKFNLICASYGTGSVGTSISGNQRLQWFQISGLQFINTLRVTTGYRQGEAFSPQMFYQTSNQADAEFCEAPMSITTFRKPESENVDLTFISWNANNGGEQSGFSIGLTTFSFSVVGVKE